MLLNNGTIALAISLATGDVGDIVFVGEFRFTAFGAIDSAVKLVTGDVLTVEPATDGGAIVFVLTEDGVGFVVGEPETGGGAIVFVLTDDGVGFVVGETAAVVCL